MPGGRAEGGEDAVEVDVDHPLPALIGVVLQRALGVAHPRAGPAADEAGAGIDPGVGEDHVQLAVFGDRLVEGAVEGGMVGDVDHGAADVVAQVLQPGRLGGDALPVDVEHGHPRAVLGQRLGEAQAQPAGAPGDDGAVAFDAEQIRDLHRRFLPFVVPRSWNGAGGGSRGEAVAG